MFSVEMSLTSQNGNESVSVLAEVGARATFSVIPGSLLRNAGFIPSATLPFELPDGTIAERDICEPITGIGDRSGTSSVIFGDDDGPCLVGTITLGRLLLETDAEGQKLVPFLPRLRIRKVRPKQEPSATSLGI